MSRSKLFQFAIECACGLFIAAAIVLTMVLSSSEVFFVYEGF